MPNRRSIELTPFTFVDGAWEMSPTPPRTAPCDLRLLTWNVWFGGHMFDERAVALVDELERRRPDVIVLQEVTSELLPSILRAPWVRDGYQLSDADGRTLGGYGVMLLSRQPIRRMTLLDLPSRMGRSLLIAELACGLTVSTIHLESTDVCELIRATQLRIIQPHLAATSDDVVLAGDMNFAPDATHENQARDLSFVDLWPQLRGDEPGYSVDTDVNTMRYDVKSKHTHKRIDRIFLRSPRWRGGSIELVGTAPIDMAGTFISDHFGLEASLVVG